MYEPTTGRWLSEDPIDFLGGDASLYRYAGNDPANRVDPDGLYERDIHYYMTFYLAYAAGIPEADATEIARANELTDRHADTEPLQPKHRFGFGEQAIIVRRKFHFRTTGETVKAGSAEAAQIIDEAIKAKKKSNILLGIGMHAYQDSWSHEGFGPSGGHALNGPRPDWPYNDTKKAMKMAEAVYKKIEEYRVKHFPDNKRVKSFADMKKTLEALMARKGNEAERGARWKKQIKDDFTIDTSYDPRVLYELKWVDAFRSIATDIKEPKKP